MLMMVKKSELPLPGGVPERLLDKKQLAVLLAVSEKTVQRLQDAGRLPVPVRIGRLVRWRLSDVLEWLKGTSSSAARPRR